MSSTHLILIVASSLIFACCLQAMPQKGGAYNLPAGSDDIVKVKPIKQSFTCEGKEYGYYADIDNDCQIFHVCNPLKDDAGKVLSTQQHSFVCGNQTVFDQQTLTCNYATDAFPCAESASLYGTVEFGKIPAKKGSK